MSDDDAGHQPQDPHDAAGTPPRLDGPALDSRLGRGAGGRYTVGEVLGAGGIGRVLLVEDANLRRQIAVKTPLPWQAGDAAAVEAFVAEAQITASLEHPGIVPVHDLDLSADGQIYYAMRRIRGRSLGAAIGEALAHGRRPREIATTNDIVTILLKACDAIAYAHSRGVIHRDLKPDNIMLGGFGEVLVLDWGASSSLGLQAAGRPSSDQFGTPAFMSPEQARQEPIGPASDVYSLGATLFQTLFLRFPIAAPDTASYLARKQRGEIDPPQPHELDASTRPLAAIALRAMAADPAARYPGVEALAVDLRAYQAGQAVTAYRGTVIERGLRWLRAWWRVLATVGVCAASIAVAVWLVWGERLKEVAAWGAPVVSEDFHDGSWTTRWDTWPADACTVRDGRLLTIAREASLVRCLRTFGGPVAIAYTGEITPGSRPCDISVVWWDGEQEPGWVGAPREGWMLQIGAFDNTGCAIFRAHHGNFDQVARASLRLEIGRPYHVRAEFDGNRIAVNIDGRNVLAYQDLFPVKAGHIGLYGYYAGKTFDDVRIYTKGVPERLSPIALGDDLAEEGDLARAIERYQRVIASHPGGALADEAWYKIGHCHALLGDDAAAWRAWAHVSGPPFSERVEMRDLARRFDAGDHQPLFDRLPGLADGSAERRGQAEALWSDCVGRIIPRLQRDPSARQVLDRLVAVRQRVFPGMGPSLTAYGQALNALCRWEQVIAECGDDARTVADALVHLGRAPEALQRFGRLNWLDMMIRREVGDLTGQVELVHSAYRYTAMAKLGHAEEALRAAPTPTDWQLQVAAGDWASLLNRSDADDGRVLALLALGRPEEAVAGAWRTPPRRSTLALLLLGRFDEAEAARVAANDPRFAEEEALRLVAALARGDRPGAVRAAADVRARRLDWMHGNGWVADYLILPYLAWRAGDAGAWAGSMGDAVMVKERAGQRLWHLAAFVTGRIDEAAFLAQPYRAEAGAWLCLGKGLKAELAGDPAGARAAYAAFQALPLPQRLLDWFRPDPVVERFVAWRQQELGGR